jgi:predicted choloylglycine hydrolase
MRMTFQAISEPQPGSRWRALFDRLWPAYRQWFLGGGGDAHPALPVAQKRLHRYMPELVPIFERLVDLAGGDELSARFLSCYRPPVYLIGCSQAVWTEAGGPLLVRNYDLDPGLHEGVILHSCWNGRRVVGTSEFLWGLGDGLNDSGLAVSLAFGGRNVIGDGFGISLILRYLLEVCDRVREAVEVLRSVPSHMAYNVTLLDRSGDFATVQVAPDRAPVVTRDRVATNHQGAVEWQDHARFTATLERERWLLQCMEKPDTTADSLVQGFLRAPLFRSDYQNGFGTLYTAVFCVRHNEAFWHWPDGSWAQSCGQFCEGTREVSYHHRASRGGGHHAAPPQPRTGMRSGFDQFGAQLHRHNRLEV